MDLTTAVSAVSLSTTKDPLEEEKEFVRNVYFAVLAVFIPCGLVLNIMAIIVLFMSSKLRKTSTGHFMIALAFADITFLLGEFLRWLNTYYDTGGYVLGINFKDTTEFWCKVTYSLRYTGQLLSAMLTVAITIQRTICIFQPLKAAVLTTPRRAKISLTILCSIFVPLGFSGCFLIGVLEHGGISFCGYIRDGKYYIWYWIVIRLLTMILPWCTLFGLTCAIAYKLSHVKKFRKESTAYGRTTSGASVYQGVEKQLTRMLLLVVIAFLVLRAPYIVAYDLMQNRYKIWNPLPHHVDFRLTVITDMADCLSVLNYCINFFLYFASGSAFRHQFLRVCCRCFQRSEAGIGKLEDNPKTTATKTTPFSSLTNIHACLQPMQSVST